MTALERRSTQSLAFIFALRMLGLFLVLPVFALEARKYPGGDDPALVGLAMGIYGLTQGVLQIPFGIASDRFGRKPVIVVGLLLFALGALVSAGAETLHGLVLGQRRPQVLIATSDQGRHTQALQHWAGIWPRQQGTDLRFKNVSALAFEHGHNGFDQDRV